MIKVVATKFFRRSKVFFNFRSHNQKLLIFCFDRVKFDVLTPTLLFNKKSKTKSQLTRCSSNRTRETDEISFVGKQKRCVVQIVFVVNQELIDEMYLPYRTNSEESEVL
jgi:hypothetical protein